MITEKDAKELWCPFARAENIQKEWDEAGTLRAIAFDGSNREDKKCRCIGSACMAWRWDGPKHDSQGIAYTKRHGRCGLAGDP